MFLFSRRLGRLYIAKFSLATKLSNGAPGGISVRLSYCNDRAGS